MKEMRRVLALVLCFVMLVGLVPVSALAAEAETTAPSETVAATEVTDAAQESTAAAEESTPETEAPVVAQPFNIEWVSMEAASGTDNNDYLFIATDRHANTSVIGNIINNMENYIGEEELDYLALGGDMVGSGNNHPEYSSSTVLAEVTGATSSLDAENVDIVAGIHDMNVTDDEGIVLPYQGGGAEIYESDRFYVYGVEEYCISDDSTESNWSKQASAFQSWATGSDIDKSKAIIVVSHYPLHVNRNDNDGAYYWHKALNAVATGGDATVERNIVFFHGHNHTVDPNEYVYNVGDTMSIQNGSSTTSDTIYYTYATAGYLNQNSKATLVTITDSTISLTKYGTSGSGTAMTSVNRAVTPTVNTVECSGTYVEDGETVENSDYLTAKGLGLTGMTAVWNDTDVSEVLGCYSAYDVTLEGYTEGDVTVTLDMNGVDTADGVKLYFIAEDGTLTEVTDFTYADTETGMTVTFTVAAASFSVAAGNPAADAGIPADAALTRLEIAGPTKTKYFLDTEVINGNVYLDIEGLEVTAIYTYEGVEYPKALDWNQFNATVDGYGLTMDDLTTAGKKTVTVTYGDAEPVTFTVWVCEKQITTESGITVTFDAESVVSMTVAAVEADETVNIAVADKLSGTVVAYDIAPVYANNETALTGTATVTLPIPEGVTNPAVYYVSDDGATVTKMSTTVNEGGTVTFTTDHFSIYVVGDASEEAEKDLTLGSTTTTTKTVYVLTSSISSGKSYLIVNGNAAGSYYALANNSGSVAATGVTVQTDSEIGTYIELDDATDELWTTSGSSSTTLKNGSYYLTYSGSRGNYSLDLSTSSATWTYSSNMLSLVPNRTTYYLAYDSGWDFSSNSDNVYFYVPTEVKVTVDNSTTYKVVASDIEHIYTYNTVDEVTTVDLTKTAALTYELQADGETASSEAGVWSVYVVSDTDGILDQTNSTNEALAFTGKTGTATVRIYYQQDANGDGDVTDTDDYKVWTTIDVVAKDPYYTIELHEAELTKVETGATYDANKTYYEYDTDKKMYVEVAKDVLGADNFAEAVAAGLYTSPGVKGDLITAPVVLKGISKGDSYSVWAVVTKHTATGEEELGTLGNALTWYVSDQSIATINSTTGVITFTGENYGTFDVTVQYKGDDGKIVEDTITISVSENLYIVPGDGTNDFPQYPQEGAVRINKTATAVGTYSETGVAMVELSMTGVPYTTGSEIDVVIMLDMTGSMSTTAIAAARAAAIAFADQIIKNEDGTYNNNRISVQQFNTNGATELWALSAVTAETYSTLTSAINGSTQASGGTPYDEALAECQSILQDAKTDGIGNNRKQFCVFMSDGGPTSYKYITNYDAVKNGTATSYTTGTASATGGSNQSDSNFATIATYTHEYYSTLMKDDGVTMYTVLTGLVAANYPNCTTIMKNIASDSAKAYVVENGSDTSALSGVLTGIGMEIKQAATNVVVQDEVGNMYTLSFALPKDENGATIDTGSVDEFFIQVVEYDLNSTTHERTGTYTVIENFTFNANGTLKSHTLDGTACSDCKHVTLDASGAVTKIEGTYFTYEVGEEVVNTVTYTDANGEKKTYTDTGNKEYLTWKADKLTNKELALQYFAHLDNSSDAAVASQVPAGSYYTNEEATVSYTNFQGNEVGQTFPKPQMTWNGAQVTYLFYLVNEAGQPVNQAGKVVPFTEAVFVTDPYTHAVTWNDMEGTDNVLAQDIAAKAKVPGVYSLYDSEAKYTIRVYQTETVDGEEGTNFNYFVIDGAATGLTSNTTTKVYNSLKGTKYDDYGVYSHKAKDTDVGNGLKVTVTTTDIDYANTTVAFAVLWTKTLKEDTVVVDYGLNVDVNVITNDLAGAEVVAVGGTKPDAVINTGLYNAPIGAGSSVISTKVNGAQHNLGTATVLNGQTIRFVQSGMQFIEPAVIYYESKYIWQNGSSYDTNYLYSTLTVIPATTVYYEDTFLTLSSYSKGDDGAYTKDETSKWKQVGTTTATNQDVDRPGELLPNMSDTFDADNVYGYDSHYDTCSTYSLGSAQKITVDAATRGEATFTFYGTGFDVIGLTSNTTGSLTLKVYSGASATGTPIKTAFIDTYYGCVYAQWYNTYEFNVTYKIYTYDGSSWNLTTSGADDSGSAPVVDKLPDSGTEGQTAAIKVTKWEKIASTQDEPDTWLEKLPASAEDGEKVTVAEKEWTATADENTLYQIPVIKISELNYGQYTVKLTAGYNSFFDHTGEGSTSYDLYLDSIRIYDPTGDKNDTANSAYGKDGEAKPEYIELRNMLISEASFNEAGDKSVTGAIFIDHVGGSYTITDYENYGPNNELYLAAGQAVTFVLNAPSNMADVQIGIKSADGSSVTVKMSKYATTSDGAVDVTSSTAVLGETDGKAVSTATDRYYSIGNHLSAGKNWLSFQNVGSSGVVSITNIKVTKTDSSGTETTGVNISQNEANTVLMLLNEQAQNAEPEVAPDADLDVSIRGKNIKVGSNITVMATTSADVDYLMVNGQKVTKYTENKSTGKRSWSVNVRAAEAGDMEIAVTAYSADGDTLETVTETVEVTAKNGGAVQQIIGQLIGMLGR